MAEHSRTSESTPPEATERTRLHFTSRGVLHAVEVLGHWFDVEFDYEEGRGIVEYQPRRVIKMNGWDSEVFLHECIHIAFAIKPPHLDNPWWLQRHFTTAELVRFTDGEQEVFVQHLSHILDDLGWVLLADVMGGPPKEVERFDYLRDRFQGWANALKVKTDSEPLTESEVAGVIESILIEEAELHA